MTNTLRDITILVPGRLLDHAVKRVDKTFTMIRLDDADPALVDAVTDVEVERLADDVLVQELFQFAVPRRELPLPFTLLIPSRGSPGPPVVLGVVHLPALLAPRLPSVAAPPVEIIDGLHLAAPGAQLRFHRSEHTFAFGRTRYRAPAWPTSSPSAPSATSAGASKRACGGAFTRNEKSRALPSPTSPEPLKLSSRPACMP